MSLPSLSLETLPFYDDINDFTLFFTSSMSSLVFHGLSFVRPKYSMDILHIIIDGSLIHEGTLIQYNTSIFINQTFQNEHNHKETLIQIKFIKGHLVHYCKVHTSSHYHIIIRIN
jgi:hypothetical protein